MKNFSPAFLRSGNRIGQMVLFRILLLVLLVAPLSWPLLVGADDSSERDFTDDQGREIRAKIVVVRDGKVHLKRNNKVFQFPISKLSEKDQKYVQQWAINHIDYWITFSEKIIEDVDKQETGESGGRKIVRKVERYQIEVTNRGGISIKEATMKYQIAIRKKGSGRQEDVYMVSGESDFPFLEGAKVTKLELRGVDLLRAKWEGNVLVKISQSNGRDLLVEQKAKRSAQLNLDGVWVKVFLGEKVIAEYKSKGKTMEKAIWGKGKNYDPELNIGL